MDIANDVVGGKADECSKSPSGALLRALGEFNRGDWFDCHETLEELWVGSDGEIRDFYQGVLQIAVALHHWRNGNYKGAMFLLETGSGYLGRVRPVCQRIDVTSLVAAAVRLRNELEAFGPERMADLDRSLIPKMHLAAAEQGHDAGDH